MARRSKEGWKTVWWNWLEAKRGIEGAAVNGEESSHSAHVNI